MSYYAYPQSTPAPDQHHGQAQYQSFAPQPAQPGAHAVPQAGMMQPGGYYAGYHPAYQQAPMAAQPGASAQPFFNLSNDRFLKGLLIGAAAAYLLTNESVQRTAIKGVVKLWGGLQGGVEEIKERFHDAEAELQASESHKDA
jgi:hypothetical protein